MMSLQKRVKKMTLEDIPSVGTAGRLLMLRMTTLKEYKKALNSGIPGFKEKELNTIEKKYEKQKGMLMEDVQTELKQKGWLVKPNTIKHYIQKQKVPGPAKARQQTPKGAVSIYPVNFIRHLNFVRFWLNAGRNTFEEMLKTMWPFLISTHEELQQDNTSDDCFMLYDHGFIHAFLCGIQDIEEGLQYGEEAINLAYSEDKKNRNKYMSLLNEIEKATNLLRERVKKFESEARSQTFNRLDLVKKTPI